ncbi:hypothetical protein ACHAXT_003972 [Thalassiosira profunda]
MNSLEDAPADEKVIVSDSSDTFSDETPRGDWSLSGDEKVADTILDSSDADTITDSLPADEICGECTELCEDCRRRRVRDEALFKQPEESDLGDCQICFIPLPVNIHETQYMSCCAQTLCTGCFVAVFVDGDRKCPFCRGSVPSTDEEILERVTKRAASGDAESCYFLGHKFLNGMMGLRKDPKRAFELLTEAANLGLAHAHVAIGNMFRTGDHVEQDLEKAMFHLEEAAIRGNILSRSLLGELENDEGRADRAIKHWIIAAKMGDDDALSAVKAGYTQGLVSKEDFSSSLRAWKDAVDATKKTKQEKGALESLKDISMSENNLSTQIPSAVGYSKVLTE